MQKIVALLRSLNEFDAKLLKISLLAFTVLAPTIAVLCGSPGSAAVLLIAGTVGIFFIRFDDITEFEISLWKGLKAKLDRSIKEANATIAQLRRLASTLSSPLVTSIALHGNLMKVETFASRQHKINEIAANLREMGVAEQDILSTLGPWRYLVGTHLFWKIYHHLEKQYPDKAADLKKLQPEGQDEDPETVKVFLTTLPKDNPELLRLCLAY